MSIHRTLLTVGLLASLASAVACGKGPTNPDHSDPPQLTALNVPGGQQGSSVSLVMSGSNLSGVTLAFSPATGITTSSLQTTATSVTATIALAIDAPTGSRQVTARLGNSTSNALPFEVTTCALPGPTNVRRTVAFTGGKVYLVHLWDRVTGATSYVVEAGPTTGSTTRTFDTATSSDPTNPGAFLEVTTGTWFSRGRTRNACGLGAPSVEFQTTIS